MLEIMTLCGRVGTTHCFNHNIRNPANKALSEIGILAWWWKLSKTMSGLKMSSFDSIVYEVTDLEIFFVISALMLVANRDTKLDFLPDHREGS